MKALLCAAGITIPWLVGHAQWSPAGMPFEPPDNQIYEFAVDQNGNTLYMAGLLRSGQTDNCILAYQQGDWDTLGYFNNSAYAVCVYNDTLVIGGAFSTANNEALSYVAYYDGIGWQPYGDFDGPIRVLKVIGGILYAGGSFDLVDGSPCVGVAKRVAGHWEQVGNIEDTSGGNTHIIHSMGEYQGNIVIGGTFNMNNIKYVMWFDGTDWQQFGEGVLGSSNDILAIQEYQGDLYISGVIEITAGNAGHAIMRWDGQQFHSLGIGPQLVNDSYQYPSWVSALVLHRNKLIAGGAFQFANHVPASLVAAWDGTEWCGVGGYTEGGVISLGVFQDTLWAGTSGSDIFNGQDMNGVAKYIWPEYADTCSDGTIGVAELLGEQLVRAWPVPAHEQLWIKLDPRLPSPSPWRLEDCMGRVILSGTSRGSVVNVTDWSPGIYFLRVPACTTIKVLVE